MATSALTLVNGFPRMTAITAAFPSIYDQTITIVSSGASPPGSLTGPISSSTPITLPASGTYTVVSSVPNMNIFLNGNRLEYSLDWTSSGAGPNFTAFQLNFQLVVGDVLDLRTERNS